MSSSYIPVAELAEVTSPKKVFVTDFAVYVIAMKAAMKYSTLKLIYHLLTVVLSHLYLFPFPSMEKMQT